MSHSKKEHIKIRLSGKTLLAITLYTTMMMAIGAGMKSCHDNAHIAREKITNTKTR